MSQFSSSIANGPDVFDAARRAEALVHDDPRTARFYARRTLEDSLRERDEKLATVLADRAALDTELEACAPKLPRRSRQQRTQNVCADPTDMLSAEPGYGDGLAHRRTGLHDEVGAGR